MLRDKLRDMDLKITELAEYLKITRPTLYKFIEDYDNNDRAPINKNVLKLFDYISNNPLVGKKTVLSFIFNNFVIEKEMSSCEYISRINEIKKYVTENLTTEKTQFIELIISKTDYDLVIQYLNNIYPLLRKRKLTDEEIKKLAPYDNLIEELEKEEY